MQEMQAGLNPGSGRSFGGRNDNPLQYSCLENSMERGAWQFLDDSVDKESACNVGDTDSIPGLGGCSGSRKWQLICWRRDRLPSPLFLSFLCDSVGKESACNVEALGSIPELGRSPGEGKGYPLWYSGLENPIDSIVHRVAKSGTRLRNFDFWCSCLKNPEDRGVWQATVQRVAD